MIKGGLTASLFLIFIPMTTQQSNNNTDKQIEGKARKGTDTTYDKKSKQNG
jgi:hypothetical protein